jgi:tetraacyldisaccharide 4'-kinase
MMWLRNGLYDANIFKSKSYDLPIINVGNLSFGGTGKTPMIEYLIRLFQDDYQLATLSRGYKRKTTGYLLANEQSRADDIGDEPAQFYRKFKNILVAVAEKRTIGIENLLALPNKPNIILLDDAFQHRQVAAGLNILLTTFEKPFFNDYVLPMGRLREFRRGYQRADLIIVTKCPPTISENERTDIINKINPTQKQAVYFSTISYDQAIYNDSEKIELSTLNKPKVIIAGIANPKLFIAEVYHDQDEVLIYPDHHHFSSEDLKKIGILAEHKLILTTEKDYMRLKNHIDNSKLFYLPITTKIISNEEQFKQQLKQYVRENSRNC